MTKRYRCVIMSFDLRNEHSQILSLSAESAGPLCACEIRHSHQMTRQTSRYQEEVLRIHQQDEQWRRLGMLPQHLYHFLCMLSWSVASPVMTSFSLSVSNRKQKQKQKFIVQIFELFKPSIQGSRDCVENRLYHSICLFPCCMGAAAASISHDIFFLFLVQ